MLSVRPQAMAGPAIQHLLGVSLAGQRDSTHRVRLPAVYSNLTYAASLLLPRAELDT